MPVLALLLCCALAIGAFSSAALAADEDIATMDGNSYTSLQAAVDEVPTDGTQKTITLLKTTEGGGVKVASGKNIVFDFGGFTYTVVDPLVGSTGTDTNAFQLLKGATVTMQNGTVKAGSTALIMVQNYCDLTLNDITLDARGSNQCQYVSSNNFGSVQIKGETNIYAADGQKAFDLYYWPSNSYADGVTVTVETTGKISGIIEYGSDGTETGKADIADKAKLEIKSGDMDVTFSTYSLDADSATGIRVTGGSYTNDPRAYVAAETAAASFTSGETTVYAVGGTIAERAAKAVDGDKIVILSGDVELTDLPNGITVKNEGTGSVTVNGDDLEGGSEVETHTHVLTKQEAVSATCTTGGHIEYYTCTCGKWFADVNAETEIVDHESVKTPAAHTLTDVAETPATATTDGVKAHQHCTVCEKNFIDGVEKTDAELKIPATGDESSAPSESSEPDESSKPADSSETDSSEAGSSETSSSGTPSTGDAGSIALWVALFAVAGAAVVIVLRRRTA